MVKRYLLSLENSYMAEVIPHGGALGPKRLRPARDATTAK